MRPFLADLHVHSVLSACADNLMLPSLVVEAALSRGLAIIALTDHNSSENVYSFWKAAKKAGLCLIPGMELTTREEVHVLALFGSVADALGWQEHVYKHLPALPNNELAFGTQLLVDADDELIGLNGRLLQTATDLSFADVIEQVAAAGGMAIPAHVDRPAFSLLSQLGFLPDDIPVGAIELSGYASDFDPAKLHPSLSAHPVVRSSDAHYLKDIGRFPSMFWLEEPNFTELCLACRRLGGRRIQPNITKIGK